MDVAYITSLLSKIKEKNPKFNLRRFSFLNFEKMRQLEDVLLGFDSSPTAKGSYNDQVEILKALQRLIKLIDLSSKSSSTDCANSKAAKLTNIGKIEEIAIALYSRGLHSAYQIASIPKNEFVKNYAEVFGDEDQIRNENQAAKTYMRAKAIKHSTLLDYLTITQHNDPYYSASRFNNLREDTLKSFRSLPDYNDLFGGADFCKCPDCRSILSPAAYFFDLMRIVTNPDYITYDGSITPIKIMNRRPDLCNILLNCNNTNTEISKLKIVNGVLLNALGTNPSTKQPYQYSDLFNISYPYNLPVNLPLQQIRTQLKEVNTSLVDIWQMLIPTASLNQIRLDLEITGIIEEAWSIYTTPISNPNDIIDQTELATNMYGLQVPKDSKTPLAPLNDPDSFIQQTNISFNELSELLFQNLSDEEISKPNQLYQYFFVNNGIDLTKAPTTGDVNKLLALYTVKNFDRANRFIRLAKSLKWSFTDLDWALRSINLALNTPIEITNAILPYLSWIQKQLLLNNNLSINQLCGFLGSIKTFGEKDKPSFFNEIFSGPSGLGPSIWNKGISWTVPNITDNASLKNTRVNNLSLTEDQIQNALATSLSIKNYDLISIANVVLKALQQKANENHTSPPTALTLASSGEGLVTLSMLYRLSLISIITGPSLSECRIAYTFNPVTTAASEALPNTLLFDLIDGDISKTCKVIDEVSDIVNWLKNSKLSTGLVQYWLTGQSNTPLIQNQILSTNSITNFVNSLRNTITPSLLTLEQFGQSIQNAFNNLSLPSKYNIRDIWNAIQKITSNGNPVIDDLGVIIFVPNKSQVENAIKSFTIDKDFINQIINVLTHYQQLQQFTFSNSLTNLYNISYQIAGILIDMAALKLNDLLKYAPISNSLNDKDPLVLQLRKIQCYASWVSTLHLSYEELATFYSNPQIINGTSLIEYNFNMLKQLYIFKRLTKEYSDSQNNFLNFLTTNFIDAQTAGQILGPIVDFNSDQLIGLLQILLTDKTVTLTDLKSVKSLDLLDKYLDFAKLINISLSNLYQLTQINSINFSSLTTKYSIMQDLAAQTWAGLTSKYKNNKDVLDKIQDSLNNQNRDALLPFTVHILGSNSEINSLYNISSVRELSEYLLTDVEVDGIVKTSYIVEGISAIQLYIYRCRNHLESGVMVTSELESWWAWLEHYRTWQANREIFLYPENYIDPSLRKNSTKLFTKLGNSLKQGILSDDSIESATSNYMTSLAPIAQINIINCAAYSYSESVPDNLNYKKLILIGATRQQPTLYYYLIATFTCVNEKTQEFEAISWSEWLPININMQPKGNVVPIFMSSKWYIFWVEQQQSGQDKDQNPLYTANIYYSYLNSSGVWVAAQVFNDSIIPNLSTRNAYCDVSISYFTSTQSTYLNYINNLTKQYCFVNDFNLIPIPNQCRLYLLPQISYTPNITIDNSRFTLAFWFNSDDLKTTNILTQLDFVEVSVVDIYTDATKCLFIGDGSSNNIPLASVNIQTYYHLVIKVEYVTVIKIQIFLNGQIIPYNFDFPQVNAAIVPSFTKRSGIIREILWFNGITLSDASIETLYLNSKAYMAQKNNEVFVDLNSALPERTSSEDITVINQSNWNIVSYNNISNFLALPYLNASLNAPMLKCIRLTSSAVEQLETSLMLGGVDELLTLSTQQSQEIPFSQLKPNMTYFDPGLIPSSTLDFNNGPMSNYYWEVFFYIPFLIAQQLQIQQQFKNAKNWFNYIFNPTINPADFDLDPKDTVTNDKYWRFIMLRSFNNSILAKDLEEDQVSWSSEFTADTKDSMQLNDYHNDPFDPNALARLRPIAYQKTLFMHYINNLINWADSLYNKYSEESINEATMLYIEAYDLLGKKPALLGECKLPPDSNFSALIVEYNKNPNEFLIGLEQQQSTIYSSLKDINPVNDIPNIYFGLPENRQFISYWNTVNSRLYNIRHSLNIDGIFDQVALFSPALNPMELVAQVASGISLAQALSDIPISTPYYRFTTLIAKAKEVTQTVIQLGQSLLAAFEKQDAEQLARLYSVNQQNLLALTRISKENQLNDTIETLKSLQFGLANAQNRVNYYTSLINNGLSNNEEVQIVLEGEAVVLQTIAQEVKVAAAVAYLLPNVFGLADGGMDFGAAVSQVSSVSEGTAQALSMSSGLAAVQASYERRVQEWTLQKTLAIDDINQISSQILAVQYQQTVAQNEIIILLENIAQEQKVENFLVNKFTSQELYQWINGKLAALYFQTYQLAYNLAKKAEQAWKFEKVIVPTQPIIQVGYWENLYRGLYAGEALLLDIYRLEQTYIDQNKRTLEIQKTIYLSQILQSKESSSTGPLYAIRSTGTCSFTLSQDMFEQDYPGQYCRQIKTVSVSFPALLGPYQNICAILTQNSNSISTTSGGIPKTSTFAINQQIALSQGLNDSGIMSLNINDERYLPFEGTGAISSWTLTITNYNSDASIKNLIQNSLTDVIVQMYYTALSNI